jgi:hypothetical protein
MNEAEQALARWRSIYDQLVRTHRSLVGMSGKADGDLVSLKLEIARLTRESENALEELNRRIAR